jgi:hypothetical protein
MVYYLSFFFLIFILFICAYNVWVISPPFSPPSLPHLPRSLPHPLLPGRNITYLEVLKKKKKLFCLGPSKDMEMRMG